MSRWARASSRSARGADVADVRAAFGQLTKGLGDTDAVLKTVRGSVDGVVSDFDLMKSVNSAFSQGLQLTQQELTTTGEAARVLADRVGGDTAEAYNTLLAAMATGRDMQLKEVNVNIDAKRAVDAYAASLGVSSDKLSENQQKLAKKQAIMAELTRTVAESGRAEVDFGDRLNQVGAMLQNVFDSIGEGIAASPVLKAGIDSLAQSFGELFGSDQKKLIDTVIRAVNDLAIGLVGVGQVAVEVGRVTANAFEGLRAGFFKLVELMEKKSAKDAEYVKSVTVEARKRAGLPPLLPGNEIDDMIAQHQGRAQGATNEFNAALDDAAAWGQRLDVLKASLDKAKAAMIEAGQQAPKTSTAVKKLTTTAKDLGTQVVVSADELKAFHKELRAIQDAGDAALSASLLTGTQAQLAALDAETKSAIANARENAKTRAMGEETVTAITEAEAKKRTAILNNEARDIAAEMRSVHAQIAQIEIASSETGLQAVLDGLAAERDATIAEAHERGLSAGALSQVLLAIDQKYAVDRRHVLVENERDIQRDLDQIYREQDASINDLSRSGVKAQLAANQLELEDRLQTIDLEKNGDEQLVKATVELYRLRSIQIVRANDPIWRAWQDLNGDMRQEWADTWEAALKGQITWKEAMLKPFKDLGNQLLKVFTGILADLEAAFLQPLREMIAGAMNNLIGQISKATGASGGSGAGGIDLGALWSSFKGSSSTIAGRAGSALMGAQGIASAMQAKTKGQMIGSSAIAGAGIGGSIVPGWGHLVGAAVGAIVGVFKAKGMAKKAVKDFEAGFGGADAFKTKLEQTLGTARADVLMKDLDGVGTSLKKANAAIKAVSDGLDDATAAQERWNLGIDDMDPDFKMRAFKETAKGLVDDFNALVAQGFNPGKAATKMADAISQVVIGAIDAGQKIPAAMAPMVAELIKSGNLSDALRAKLMGVATSAMGDWQDLEDTATKYGITLDSLGSQFQQAKLSATASQIAKDFEKLKKAGGDVNGLLDGMKDEVQGVVTQALKFGLDVPAAMKGMIEQLITMGQLTDENGNALTDLGRLNFAKPLEDSIDDLIAKLNELIDTMGQGFGLPAEVVKQVVGKPGGSLAASTSTRHKGHSIPSFADGGFANFGAGTLAMLHGREAVFPLDRLDSAMSRGGATDGRGGGNTYLTVEQRIDLSSPDAGAMRRLVRGDLKDELLRAVIDNVDGWGRAMSSAFNRFQEA